MEGQVKVKLIENLRYFDYDDSSFKIQKGEIKTLLPREVGQPMVKFFLFTGRLIVVDGVALYSYKNSWVYINNKAIIVYHANEFFLKTDELTKVPEEKIPEHIVKSLKEHRIIKKK